LQLDQCITNSTNNILNYKVTNYRVSSDHSTITIILKFKNKVDNSLKDTDAINYNHFLDDDIKLKFNEKLIKDIKELKFYFKNDCIDYMKFSKAVMSAAKNQRLVILTVLRVGSFFQK